MDAPQNEPHTPEAPQPNPGSSTTHPLFFGPEGLRAGWGLLLYIAILASFYVAMGALLHHAGGHRPKSTEMAPGLLSLTEGIPFALVAFASWILSRIEGRPVGQYGLGGERRVFYFVTGLLTGVGCLSLLVFLLKSLGLLVFDRRLLFGAATVRYGLVWLGGFLLVALLEDYLTRGYLQFTLARGLAGIYGALKAPRHKALGFWTAALLLSFLFGLGHSGNQGESPIGLVSAGLAGLVFCLSLWRTGSLWWAIGCHTTWDWAQSYLYGVADSGTMVKFHLFATHPVGRPLMSGGSTGPEGSVLVLVALALMSALILLLLPGTETAVNRA